MKFRGRLTFGDFKRYFHNNMRSKDKHDFEKRMMQDAFEEEAYDGLSRLSEKELEEDVEELKGSITRRTRRSGLVPHWFRYAASVIVLVGIGISVYLLNDRPDIISEQPEEIVSNKQNVVPEEDEQEHSEANSDKGASQKAGMADAAESRDQSVSREETDQSESKVAKKETSGGSSASETTEKAKTSASDRQRAKQPVVAEAPADQDLQAAKTMKEETEEGLQQGTTDVEVKDTRETARFYHQVTGVDKEQVNVAIRDAQGDPRKITRQSLSAEDSLNTSGIYGSDSLKAMLKDAAKRDRSSAQPPREMNLDTFKKKVLERINISNLSRFPGEHTIQFEFTVDEKGTLSGFEFESYPHAVFIWEIQNAVKSLGHWMPAIKEGKSIPSTIKMKLTLEVKE